MIELDKFPLSEKKQVKGSRRLAREKVLQVLFAMEVSESEWQLIFSHTYFRKFNLGEDEAKQEKLLTPNEIMELEADVPIRWENEEIEFGRTLVEQTLKKKRYIDGLIKEVAENWELERIAIIDRILMYIAITELIEFPEIPPKVSINEAIDIAKKYSTDKSGTFINGVLDTILLKLKEENLMKKTGRGLIDK